MFAQERHNAIKRLVREHRRLNVAQLQDLVHVSPATLRRDLTELEKSGDILRVHGGVLDPSYVRSEISFDERVLRRHAAKKSIAACVVPLIPPGSSIFVDAGSTCLEAGKVLLNRQDLRIITHSVALVAQSLHGQADLLCIGGDLRRLSGALVGGAALGALASLHADYALVGASGLDDSGCSTTELSEAEMKSAILARCTHRILLADASKWRQPSTVRFASWADFDLWVTDAKIAPADQKGLKAQGVEVRVAV